MTPREERPSAPGPGDPSTPIRLLIADDDARIRSMLTQALAHDESIEVVGVAADGEETVALAGRLRPDVALVDVAMPAGGGTHATRGIQVLSPNTKVLAYSGLDEHSAVIEMLRMGAVGYLVKSIDPDRLPDAIRRTAAGEAIISEQVAASVVSELSGRMRLEVSEDREREQLQAAIRRFITGRGISIVSQPVVDLATGEVAGVEALARFESHPPMRPDIWILEAWRLDLGYQLEVTLLRLAAQRLERLPSDVFLSVNLSPNTLLRKGFTEEDLAWDRIVLEVTEHVPVEDYTAFRKPLAVVRERGTRLAVDDAGSGFASLRHILELEPDLIKLDEAVIRGINDDPRRKAMAIALATFASTLGCEIVAEGVEEQSELEVLRKIGVRYAQGRLITGLPNDDELDDRLRSRIRQVVRGS